MSTTKTTAPQVENQAASTKADSTLVEIGKRVGTSEAAVGIKGRGLGKVRELVTSLTGGQLDASQEQAVAKDLAGRLKANGNKLAKNLAAEILAAVANASTGTPQSSTAPAGDDALLVVAKDMQAQAAILGLTASDQDRAKALGADILNPSRSKPLREYADGLAALLKGGNNVAQEFATRILKVLQLELPLGSGTPETAKPVAEETPSGDKAAVTDADSESIDPGKPLGKVGTVVRVALARLRRIAPFKILLPIVASKLEEIRASMRERGYDQSQALSVWGDVLLDGHTRAEAAEAEGITEVPVYVCEFPDLDAALAYAVHLQVARRQLSDADILRLVATLDKRRSRGGDRRSPEARSNMSDDKPVSSAEATAKLIGTSPTKVSKARTIIDSADPAVLAAVANGKTSLHQGSGAERAKKRAAKPGAADKERVRDLKDGVKHVGLAVTKVREHLPAIADQLEKLAIKIDDQRQKAEKAATKKG